MPVTKVSSIHIYPVKSTAGFKVTKAKVEELGLNFDRRFVVSDPSGQFITARTEPRLCLIEARILDQGIELSAPDMPTLTLLYKEFTAQYQKVTIWGDDVAGQLCADDANEWFSEYLNRPCNLLFFGQNSFRERKANTPNARKIAFADGYPVLLISQASLDNLNKHLLGNQQESVSMTQFRPNIVVDDCLPFAEDTWLHIRIGEVDFKVSKPCERCIFTTVNPQNGEKHPKQQPLQMLKSFRQTHDGEVLFGQNLIALNSGEIHQGDKVTIISNQEPPSFLKPHLTSDTQAIQFKKEDDQALVTKSVNKNINIFFEKWNKNFQVSAKAQKKQDKPKTLLENGEDAGLILPYSCRAGMCGRCRAKLISGEVEQYTSDGLTVEEKQEGYVLCCSAIAKSDVVIKHE
jgi:uncharacterized protein YcbX/ferredoxin